MDKNLENDEIDRLFEICQTGKVARVLVQRIVRALWRETRQYGYAVALSAGLAVVGIYCWQWQYWAVFIPTMIGVLLRPNAEHQARAVASHPECGCSQSNSTKGVR